LAAQGELIEVAAETTLLEQGPAAEFLYILQAGQIGLTTTGVDGRRRWSRFSARSINSSSPRH
jgi:hypothetical protein